MEVIVNRLTEVVSSSKQWKQPAGVVISGHSPIPAGDVLVAPAAPSYLLEGAGIAQWLEHRTRD